MIGLLHSKIRKLRGNLRDIIKTEFVVNVSTLMSGSVISQIIPFLVAPIISRLYFPIDYAVVATYNSITVLLTIVATGMYSSALMIDKSDEEAFNTAMAAFLVTITITVISLLVFFIFIDSIAKLTGNEDITFWLYLIPLTVFVTGGYQTLNMWNNRLKRYKILAFNRIFQTIITSGATLIFGFLSYHSTGLMISLLLGQAFAFSVLFLQTIRNDSSFFNKINYNKIKSSFIRHKDFPKYNMPQGFLDGFRESSIVLIISNFFGPVVLGSYSFAMGMLNKPLLIIGESYRQVYYQKASSLYYEKKDLWKFTQKNVLLFSLIVFPFFLLIFFWGKELFEILFGENWSHAGYLAQILCIWLFIKFAVSPLSSIPLILNKQKPFFIFGLIYNISLPLSLFLSSYFQLSISVSLTIFTLIGISNLLTAYYWIYKISISQNHSSSLRKI